MNFESNIPIYLQIMDDFKKQIVKGIWHGGDKVDTVRELAVSYGVNPNTVQRSLSELEREGLLYSERTSGRFITKDEQLIQRLKEEYAFAIMDDCIHALRDLNFDDEMIIELANGRLKQ